ncbi:hypothetical protein LOD99_14940 [Oopsacas minuta]|uniref:ADF-H domain-containing protein n=1 Tax=Oopsacas minuta TaxID=111878 RepID=A0AAV7KDC4_9METZ|nr:hypothetical protein LOD99_14940 [Oopsacas minuta]
MANYIEVDALNRQKENFLAIESLCETISKLQSGTSWIIIGYTNKSDINSLSVLKQGQQWNILLQILPSDHVCYVYARVEFGKFPGSCFLIKWTGEQVTEEKKIHESVHENIIISLFSRYERIIYAHSQGNLNKQVADCFKSTQTRHGSIRSSTTIRKSGKVPKRHSSFHHTRHLAHPTFFLKPTEDNSQLGITRTHEEPIGETAIQILRAKVIVVGDIAVGKSSLIHTYINRSPEFSTAKPTFPVDYLFKTVNVQKNIHLNLEIWDTMGEERFASLAPIWYRYAAAAILVYDKTNEESFKHIEDWLQRVKMYSEPHIIVLVGNKSDLSQDEVIPKAEGVTYAFEKGLMFIETSTMDVDTIDQIFYLMTRRLLPKLLELEEGSQCYMRCRGRTILDFEEGRAPPSRSDTIDLYSSFKLTNKRTHKHSNKCCN